MTALVPAVPTFTDGIIVHQADLNALSTLAADLYAETLGGFRTLRPLCEVRVTSTQTIPSGIGTDTIVSWDVADLDTDGMYNAAVPNRVTVQTAGNYWIVAQIGTNASFNAQSVRILVNGTIGASNGVSTMSCQSNRGTAQALVSLTAGASIYAVVNQTSGSPTTLATTFGGCRMSCRFVSPSS